ncbi:Transmembrane protein [Ceratobasidium theobromae]|uniref:Transmembrane protein n=1 Tax=Ceratobasidium theobromae TaxID=1582974 RepID=A0A5N5QUZ9_9AGAM|nr:Transmembrane protein [Ceratobasidium theobromae]
MAFTITVSAMRIGLFALVMLWTLIVFALLVHFQTLVIPSELTSFIPFGIIVSLMTFIILTTLIFLARAQKNFMIAQVRSELLFVSLLGFMWFALGLYTSTGVLADIEVECTDGEDGEWGELKISTGVEPLLTIRLADPSEALLAQYRVVKGFAFFNGILLLVYCLIMFLLCIRHHRAGRKQVWTSRVPTFPWFFFGPLKPGQSQEKQPTATSALPPPVTAAPRRAASAASRPTHVSRPSQQPLLTADMADLSQLAPGESRMVWIPPPQPGATRYGTATVGRSGSKQSTSSSTRPLMAPPRASGGLSRDVSKSTTTSSARRDPYAPRRTGSGATRASSTRAPRPAAEGLSRAGTGSSSRPGAPSRSATVDTQRKR